MPGLGYLPKVFAFGRDYILERVSFGRRSLLMLIFNFDFQNCQKFVP